MRAWQCQHSHGQAAAPETMADLGSDFAPPDQHKAASEQWEPADIGLNWIVNLFMIIHFTHKINDL